jgi:hypothetical protein
LCKGARGRNADANHRSELQERRERRGRWIKLNLIAGQGRVAPEELPVRARGAEHADFTRKERPVAKSKSCLPCADKRGLARLLEALE